MTCTPLTPVALQTPPTMPTDPPVPTGLCELDQSISGLLGRTVVAAGNRNLRSDLLLSLVDGAVGRDGHTGAVIVATGEPPEALAAQLRGWPPGPTTRPADGHAPGQSSGGVLSRVRFVTPADPPLGSAGWYRGRPVDYSQVAAAAKALWDRGVRWLVLVVEDLESVGARLGPQPVAGQPAGPGQILPDHELDPQRLQTVEDLRRVTRSPYQPAGAPVLLGVGLLKSRPESIGPRSVRGHAKVTEDAFRTLILLPERSTGQGEVQRTYELSWFDRVGEPEGFGSLQRDPATSRFTEAGGTS